MIAAPRGDGWLVDDAYIRGEQWLATPDGRDLWNALAGDCADSQVRFVCPTYETQQRPVLRHSRNLPGTPARRLLRLHMLTNLVGQPRLFS